MSSREIDDTPPEIRREQGQTIEPTDDHHMAHASSMH